MSRDEDDAAFRECGNCTLVTGVSCRCIPPLLREDPRFLRGVHEGDLTALVRLLRANTTLTQTALGKILRLPQGTISRIESGKLVVEDRYKVKRALACLGATTTPHPPVPVLSSTHGGRSHLEDFGWSDEDAMAALSQVLGDGPTRRTVLALAGSAVASQVLGWALADPLAAHRAGEGGPVSDELCDRLAESVDALRMADAQNGASAALRGTAQPQLLFLHQLLKSGNTSGHYRRLLGITADLTGLLGWMAVDAGEAHATSLLVAGLRAAHSAADPVLGAGIVSYMAVHAYSHGHGREAALMASTALHRVQDIASPRVECLLWIRQARGHAAAGEEHKARLALDHARATFERGPREDDPRWLYWIDEGELACQSGTVLLETGHPDEAIGYLDRALEGYHPALVRDQASSQIRAAKALGRMGEIDAASQRAHAALDLVEGLASRRTNDQVRDLVHKDLAPYSKHPAVTELVDRSQTLIGAKA